MRRDWKFRFSSLVTCANRLRLNLHPNQMPDGSTRVRVVRGQVELADLDEESIGPWLYDYREPSAATVYRMLPTQLI